MTAFASARSAAPPAAAMLPSSSETGALGIMHLKRYWARMLAARTGAAPALDPRDRHLDFMLVHATGLGLEQASDYLARNTPDFAGFERWIVDVTGGVEPERVARINAAVEGLPPPEATARRLAAINAHPPVLSDADLRHWNEHGYVMLHDAVAPADSDAAAQALWAHIGARDGDVESWYRHSDHGIMVQYFQHPAFEANRRSPRIHKAFAQLWGSADLWVTTDRVGFNAPERPGFAFRGPDLHWDVSVKTPIPFGTQGILYLADTLPEQGAFTLVSGFQRWGADWLDSLPPGADPRRQDLHALGSKPIGGRKGDLIIWHQALPHGASPNRADRPRLVQYINMFPTWFEEQTEWI